MAFGFIKKALGQSVEKLRSGLTRTRDALVGSLRTLLTGRKLDQQLLDELRQRLITADLGVVATDHIITDLNAAWKQGRVQSGDEVLAFLKEDMRAYWPVESRALKFAPSGPTVILVTGINGAGKTTSIAKLGQYLKNQNKTVMVAGVLFADE